MVFITLSHHIVTKVTWDHQALPALPNHSHQASVCVQAAFACLPGSGFRVIPVPLLPISAVSSCTWCHAYQPWVGTFEKKIIIYYLLFIYYSKGHFVEHKMHCGVISTGLIASSQFWQPLEPGLTPGAFKLCTSPRGSCRIHGELLFK